MLLPKRHRNLLNTTYKVGLKSDRMAIYAESSESIEHKNSADIISDPAVLEVYKCQKWYSYHFNGRKTKHRRLYKNSHGYRK